MSDWYLAGLEDDLRPRMFDCVDRGEPFALVTIVASEGGGPRGLGAQMVVTADGMAGFLSGGCIEADVALHARETLADGELRRLVYGRGSPFVDTRLPCGGRLELLVERIAPDDVAIATLRVAEGERRLVTLASDGRARTVLNGDVAAPDRLCVYPPRQRLVVVGGDPFALAMAAQGAAQGWATTLVRPNGPEASPPLPVAYRRDADVAAALDDIGLDAWTAVALATHDSDLDDAALPVALAGQAGYVGLLGSRRRLPDRLARLAEAGLDGAVIDRLHAPIGLRIAARTPQEVATAVIGEIIASRA